MVALKIKTIRSAVAASLAIAAAGLTSACGGAHRANDSASKVLDLGGTLLSPSEVASYLRSAGFPESAVGVMVCIAKYESSYYTGATNVNNDGSVDYGLFQINGYYWAKACGVSESALLDPSVNGRCALRVYREQGFNAWYGYQAHAGECNATGAPSGGSGGGGIATKIAKSQNKLYSGLSRDFAFCSNIPVGTSVTVLSDHGSMSYVSIPAGKCTDWKGRTITEGFLDSGVLN